MRYLVPLTSDDIAYLRFRRLLFAQKMDDARGTIRSVVFTSVGSLVVVAILLAVNFA